MAETDVDLFVIGAGSGGVRAARIAAGHGARVMIAEEHRVGGTCVIRGCIPKKLLIYASRYRYEFEDAVGFGWTVDNARFDWPTLIKNKDKEIARLEAAYRANLDKAGVEIVDSRAVIEDDHTVRVLKSGAHVRADKILVATGGHPYHTHCPGIEFAISSNDAFHLPALPRRIAIVGAGYVGLEFAAVFEGLGSQVTIVHRGDEILRGLDADVRRHAHDEIEARGVRILLKHTVSSIEKGADGLRATLSDGAVLEVDQVMLAVGRRPNTTNLGLETVGVPLDPLGRVMVDKNNRSDVHSIYAIGDVTNRLNLTPIAIREGHAFADSAFGEEPWIVDHVNVPTAVFSEPEIGVVGLSEADARLSGRKVKTFKKIFRPLKATLSGRKTQVLMKLVVDEDSDRVLGVHVVGEGAAEMAQLAAVAVKMGARKADFDATVALHPTAAEELVTLRSEA
ncbi:MAG TPA: glutathione-disulfide reductase [Xanthobacteraceae bacterium]|nr:glutathione-disulfide reductase [Xanthobacteraceae bacterium]